MQQKRKRWTPEEDLELKRYFALGCYTSAEIAEKLGRKKSQVDARKHKLGLTAIKLSAKNPAHVAQVVKFRMAGWTQKAIGEVFGVTHAHISYVLCVNGFVHFRKKYPKTKRYKNTWTDIELASLRKCLLWELTTAEIQEKWLPHRSRDAINQKRSLINRFVPNGFATYYHCTHRDRYGIPTAVERHIYENGELKKVENRSKETGKGTIDDSTRCSKTVPCTT